MQLVMSGDPLPYSHYLEYGTYKMAPRPHLKVAFQKAKPDVEKLFKGFYYQCNYDNL